MYSAIKYKLDNSKLSKICIVKLPKDGCKIVMLTIDSESIIKRQHDDSRIGTKENIPYKR